jgi:hypothetical protein
MGTSMGTGAVAAGRAIPVMPGRGLLNAQHASTRASGASAAALPRVSVPVATTSVAGIPTAAAVPASSHLKSALAQAASRVSATPDSVRPGQVFSNTNLDLPERFGFLYLIKRVFAFGIDALVNTTLCFLALGAVMVRLELSWDAFSNMSLLLLGVLFLAMFNWSIMTAQEVLLGTTLGKRMFGLVLRGDTSALFLRSFFFLPSMVFCGLGIVWAVFDRRRRCWHDHAVDVQPLELAQL